MRRQGRACEGEWRGNYALHKQPGSMVSGSPMAADNRIIPMVASFLILESHSPSGANSNHMVQIGLETATGTNSETSVKIQVWLRPASRPKCKSEPVARRGSGGYIFRFGNHFALGNRGLKGCWAYRFGQILGSLNSEPITAICFL